MRIVGFECGNYASTELRVAQWIRAFKRMGHDASYHGDISEVFLDLDNIFNGADIVISGHMHNAQRIAALLAGRKIYDYRLIIDTDDLVTAVPTYNQASTVFHAATGFRRIAATQYREADAVIAATRPLQEATKKHNPNTYYMPNCVDPETYANLRFRPREPRYADDLRIYWGGGGGHYDDLLIVKEPLLRIFRERPNVKLVFSNFVPAWAVDLPARRVFMLPLVLWEAYPKLLAWLSLDVAIAPLVDNEFNRCKSHCKWLDYSMAGIAGVYQRIDAYKSVEDNVTGLLAGTSDEWYERINHLLDHPEERRPIVVAARREIDSRFRVGVRETRYEALLQELIDTPHVPAVKALTEGVPIACPI